MKGHDFRDNTEQCTSEEYSTYLYGNRSLQIMEDHVASNSEHPFFLYFSSQAVHSPWSAPQDVVDSFAESIDDEDRRTLAAVTTILDDTVGQIVEWMKSAESGYLWDETLFIVSSDNGGDATIGSSNFPLRGSKATLWEGGVKAAAFVTGGFLPNDQRGQKMDALMHVVDWYPTLCTLLGVDLEDLAEDQPLDGLNQLDNILNGFKDRYHPRDRFVINITPSQKCGMTSGLCGGVRWRNYKLVVGNDVWSSGTCWSDWYVL